MTLDNLPDEPPPLNLCGEPMNVWSGLPDPVCLISNLAHTPFDLDGQQYASVEGFWQGLKYPSEERRREVSRLYGGEARKAGSRAGKPTEVTYEGERIQVGAIEHWRLMARACRAKFFQHEAAREALIATGYRPLMHVMRRDSRSIPGAIMANIWMTLRRDLQEAGDAFEP